MKATRGARRTRCRCLRASAASAAPADRWHGARLPSRPRRRCWTNATSASVSGTIPCRRPLSIASGELSSWPSAMIVATAGVPSSSSRAATRPPPDFRSSTCATTPRSVPASIACNCGRRSARRLLQQRDTASGALCAAIPAMTRWPAAAASMASAITSGVRRSSITSTSGALAQRAAQGGQQILAASRAPRAG